MKVIKWTDFDLENAVTPNEPEYKEAEDVVIEEIRKNGYHFNGDYHQEGDFGCPLLDNGKLFACSKRTWGDIIARAFPEEFENPNDPYNYIIWYLGSDDDKWKIPYSN